MSQIREVSVAILAGGKSLRFGYPKTFANFQGKTLIQYCIENAINISKNVSIITTRNSPLCFNNVKTFQDLIPDKGPLSGIYTALKFSQTPLIAIMPCDMPLLDPNIYRLLYHAMKSPKPIAAVLRQQIQPLVSIWPKPLINEISYFLNNNQTSVYKVLRRLNCQKYHLATGSMAFLNINTRKDYQVLLRCTASESYASRS